MGYKVIKVSEKNYTMLLKEASRIQYETGKKATFDDAIGELVTNTFVANQKKELLKFAGIWKDMPDEVYEDMMRTIEEGRKVDTKREKELWN